MVTSVDDIPQSPFMSPIPFGAGMLGSKQGIAFVPEGGVGIVVVVVETTVYDAVMLL